MNIDRFSSDAARMYLKQADTLRTQPTAPASPVQRINSSDSLKRDSVSLSEGARSLAHARAAVDKSPEVREDKIADIKQQIATGTYEVSARVLARKIVDNVSARA